MEKLINIGLLGERESTPSAEQLEEQGLAYMARWEYHHALACFSRALKGFQQQDNLLKVADQYRNLGNLYLSVQMFDEAAQHHQQALEIAENIGYVPGIVKSLANLGRAFLATDSAKALDYGARALAVARGENLPGSRLLEDALLNMGWLYGEMQQHPQALACYEQVLELLETDLLKRVHVLVHIATCYQQLDDAAGALKVLQLALQLSESDQSLAGKAHVIAQLGYFFDEDGQQDKAFEHYEQALILYQGQGNHLGEMTMLEAMGYLFLSHSRFKDAIAYYQRALELSQMLDNPYLESETLLNLATIHAHLDQFAQAQEYYQAVIQRKRAIHDIRGLVESQLELGKLLNMQGELSQAEQHLQQASQLAREHRLTPLLARSLYYLGENAAKLEKWQLSLQYFQEAAIFAYKTENTRLHLLCSHRAGQLYLQLQEPEEAVRFYEEALSLAFRLEEHPLQVTLYQELAEVYRQLGKEEKAYAMMGKGLLIIEANNGEFTPDYHLQYLKTNGEIHFFFQDFPEARLLFTEALELPSARQPQERVDILRLIGLCSGHLQEFDLFTSAYGEALHLAQQAGNESQVLELHKDMASIYGELGHLAAAIEQMRLIFQNGLTRRQTGIVLESLEQLHQLYSLLHQQVALLPCYQEAVDSFRQWSHKQEAEFLLIQMAEIAVNLGNRPQAIAYLEEVLAQAAPATPDTIQLSLNLGSLYEEEGEHEEALRLFQEALQQSRHQYRVPDEISALIHLGILHHGQGNPDKGIALLNEGLNLARVQHESFYEAWGLCKIGSFFLEAQALEKAQPHLEKALSLFRRLQDTFGEEECLTQLGLVYLQSGKI